MSTYIRLQGDPDEVSATGARLKAEAEAFGAQAKSILGDIQSIEAQQPWGSDEPGQKLLERYNQAPAGGAPFSQSLRDQLSTAGDELSRAGDAVMLAMVDYQSTDATNADDIKNV